MADDMRTLGYICPKCGAQVMGARSVFALEASDAEIECSCGGSVHAGSGSDGAGVFQNL